MKKILIPVVFLLSLFPVSSFAQFKLNVKVTNIEVHGATFTINYDAVAEGIEWYEVALFLSVDGGKSFKTEPLKQVSGDVGVVKSAGHKHIVWKARNEQSVLTGTDLVFKVGVLKKKELVRNRFFVLANVAVNPGGFSNFSSAMSYGLTIGWAKRFGVYLKGRSNFKFTKTQIECNSSGEAADGNGWYWMTGESQVSRLNATGGLLVYAGRGIYLYAGGGYGSRTLAWKTTDGQWAKITDYSFSGVALDLGLMAKFGPVSVSLGANCTSFKYLEPELGVGVIF